MIWHMVGAITVLILTVTSEMHRNGQLTLPTWGFRNASGTAAIECATLVDNMNC